MLAHLPPSATLPRLTKRSPDVTRPPSWVPGTSPGYATWDAQELLREPPFRCNGSLEGWPSQVRAAQTVENTMGNRLYVGNLSFQSTTESVRTAFAAHGEVTDVQLVT